MTRDRFYGYKKSMVIAAEILALWFFCMRLFPQISPFLLWGCSVLIVGMYTLIMEHA